MPVTKEFIININTEEDKECNELLQLLIKTPDKIDWSLFSTNSTFIALQLLRENTDKIKWSYLSFGKKK